MHLKRNNVPKFWPVPRKGTRFLAVPSHNQREAIPLIVAMRDILKLVRNKKELQRIIHEKKILVNNKIIHELNYPLCLFDIITLAGLNKNYKAVISENKKIVFEEVSDKETKTKILKVIGKKMLPSKKLQLNLMHGWNVISNEKANAGDSVLINLEDNKIIRTIPLEKGRKAFVFKGKHAGKNGKIEEILERGGKKIIKITSKSEKINVWTKNIIVME
jgi:small subunit ribosomal protein S4e